jgi:hypothetical protein
VLSIEQRIRSQKEKKAQKRRAKLQRQQEVLTEVRKEDTER